MAHPNKDAVKSFGIVTGVGSLSEEVMRLAEAGEYTRFVISEWPGVFGSLHGFWAELFARSGRGVRLNPFHFDQIRQEIIARQIERAFLVGDFPPSRFFQVWMNERRRRHLKGIADERCIEGIATAPQELSKPAQYFYALQNLLTSLGVRPVRSCEVFPQLNLRVGNNTSRQLSDAVHSWLPSVVEQMSHRRPSNNELRPSQAAVVVGGQIRAYETKGTNNLLREYAANGESRIDACLVKLPTAEFDPVFDEPTIGPVTIHECKLAKVSSIIVCAETTRVANKTATLEKADGNNIAMFGLPFNQLREQYLRSQPTSWVRTASIESAPR